MTQRRLPAGFGQTLVWSSLLALLGGVYLYHQLETVHAAAAGVISLLVIAFLYLAPALAGTHVRLGETDTPRAALLLLPGLLSVAYLIHSAGAGSLRWSPLLQFALAVFIPSLLMLAHRRDRAGITWLDLLVLGTIWIPFDFRWTKQLWSPQEYSYSANSLVITCLLVYLFAGFRRVQDLGYNARVQRPTLEVIGLGFLAMFAVCVPVGLFSGFLVLSDAPKLWQFPLVFIGVFLTVAIPEEVMFRGILQNLLAKRTNVVLAVVAASFLFGASHFNNDLDFRYFGLATYAGVVLGWTYHRTQSVTAAAIVHALVDAIWICFFDRH